MVAAIAIAMALSTTTPTDPTAGCEAGRACASCDAPSRCPADVDCTNPSRRALAAAACVCLDAGGTACAGANLSPRIARRLTRAWTALEEAAISSSDRASARRARTAIRALELARRAVGSSGLTTACAAALAADFAKATSLARAATS
jgi:hypothetical protein